MEHIAVRLTRRSVVLHPFSSTSCAPGAPYFYVLRSRDAAGNEHETSAEVSAAAREPSVTYWIYVPLVVK